MARQIPINFRLVGDEARSLQAWSSEEYRRPSEQVHYIIRRALESAGYLQPTRPSPVRFNRNRRPPKMTTNTTSIEIARILLEYEMMRHLVENNTESPPPSALRSFEEDSRKLMKQGIILQRWQVIIGLIACITGGVWALFQL